MQPLLTIMEQSLTTEFATLISNVLEKHYTVTRVKSNFDPKGTPESEFHIHIDCRLVRVAVIYSMGDYYALATTACGAGHPFNELPYSKTFDLIDPDCFEKMAELLRRKIHE